MSNESEQQPCMVITLNEFKFQLEDPNEPTGFAEYKGKMEISYDGTLLGIDAWEAPLDQDFSNSPIQQITLVGPDQANLLVGGILALLESYGQPSLYNDKDIQTEYQQMAQEAKDAHAEKTTKQLGE